MRGIQDNVNLNMAPYCSKNLKPLFYTIEEVENKILFNCSFITLIYLVIPPEWNIFLSLAIVDMVRTSSRISLSLFSMGMGGTS